MRPIVMDMHGFASFRDATRVDFADADFFALVGPTGSGKSTVIDAMTFALYGSVPRWGRKGMVSLALAPTVARGTVKLVFEADRQRYVVARELRRVGGQVSQRAASLERLLDPRGLAEPGEQTVPMAKDLAGVTEVVERLLGLSYEDFVQCVVLPQGQFADFLHAKPGERQEILLRLLGVEHYKQMMMTANQRASVAGQRAATFGETLLGYADATAEAEDRARAAATALARLGGRVAGVLPEISAGQAALAAADDRLRQLRIDHAALSALRVPDTISALDAGLASSRTALAGLQAAERTAEEADAAARDALAHGPQRAPLELARTHREERDRRQSQIPGLEAEAKQRVALADETAAAVETASAALEKLRTRRDEAARSAEAAWERVERLNAEHAALAAVSVPGDVAELDERRTAAATAVTEAARAVEEAEQAEREARAARNAAVPEAPIAQASRDLSDLRSLHGEMAAAESVAEKARAARDKAEAALSAAEEASEQRRGALEETRRAHVIAGLRPHLVAGEACPLCEQTVATLPAVTPAPELDDAQARLAEAERAVTGARNAERTAGTGADKAAAALEAVSRRRTTVLHVLAGALSGPLASAPLPTVRTLVAAAGTTLGDDQLTSALTEVSVLAEERAKLGQAAERTASAVAAERERHRSAQEALARAESDIAAAREALRVARDPLVVLGAPMAGEANLAAGWASLARWAEEQASGRAATLTEARKAAQSAASQSRTAGTEFTDAERALARLRTEATTTAKDDQNAKARLSQVTGRIAELDESLRDAPSADEVTERLTLLDRLETAAAEAAKSLIAARAERVKGQAALGALEAGERTERARLSAARDGVVALGAPAIDGWGLLDAWTELATWAAARARAREQEIESATRGAATARAGVERLTGQLSADLAEAGIALPPDAVAAGAVSAVDRALERAQGSIRRVQERRSEAAELAAKQQAALDEERVARLLGDLLRANRFQRWLVAEAVDDLVAVASETLALLSGGQFDLAYDAGEFFVVDHADADARRSVRTLSGGETFQASLALALALSSQISALAAAGAARLDSIFLDEGFGTLDSETLDVVATTLETLAQGDRMVGVVTHVTALAERVPVRFRVARNARTSTVTREGFAAAEEESPS
jgi:exonuclease SbcC